MSDANPQNKMGVMPIKQLLFSMSFPMIVSMLIQALYNVVDSIFVSRISENAFSAISLAFPMQNFIIALSAGLGVGINALLSKSLGEKNYKLSNQTAGVSLFLALCSWILCIFIGFFFVDAYLSGQTEVVEIQEYGKTYVRICLFASLGIFFQITNEKLLQSTGKTTLSMIVQATGAIINIILDPIFIFGYLGLPAMGVAGAAYATVIGQSIGGCLGLYLNFKYNTDIKIDIKNIRPHLPIIKNIFKVGMPSMLMMSLGSVMVFFINGILDTFSPTAIAVFGIYYKLQSFVLMPTYGITNGMIPIIAYNYGAKYSDRIKETLKYGLIGAFCIMSFGIIIFQLCSRNLLLMFDASEEMIEIGMPALKLISLSFITAGFNIVCSATFQGLGNGLYSLWVSLGRQVILIMPIAYLLSLTGQLHFVWLAFPISEIIAFGMSIYFTKNIFIKVNAELQTP